MANGINISIGSDEKDFLRGVKNSSNSLDDLGDSLKDVDKAGSKAGDELEKDFKAAQKATKNFNDSVKDGEDALRKTASVSKSTTRDVANDFELGAREQKHLRKEAIKEIGNEAKQNASETFSSFDGSAQSFVDGIQGTLGGLVSSLGPIGLAAGAAGALAIGLINGALQNADTTSQEFRQSVADMTSELIKSGQVGKVSVGYIVAELQKLATESDNTKVSLGKLDDIATRSKSSYRDLALAYAGNTEGLKDRLKAAKESLKVDQKAEDLAQSSQRTKGALGPLQAAELQGIADKTNAQKDYVKGLETAATKADEAAKAEKLYVRAGGPEMERKAALIGQINTAYDDAAGAVDDFVNKETGIFDVAGFITAMQAREKAIHDYQNTLATSGLTAEAKAFLQSEGEETAAIQLQGYKNASPAQQAELNRIWAEAGKSNSGTYTAALTAGLPATIPGPEVVPTVAPPGAKFAAALAEYANRSINIPIYLRDPRTGKAIN